MSRGIVVFGGAGLMIVLAGAATAQERPRPPKAYLDLNFVGAQALGEFGQRVDGGLGGQAAFRVRLGDDAPVLLRMDGGFLVYGYERVGVCYATPWGCQLGPDVTTTNTVGFFGVGPELAFEGPVAPYAFATAGFSYFSTQSSLNSGDPYYDQAFDTRHFGDLVLATRFGGGLRVRFGGPGSLSLDLGAEYNRNGVTDYLAEGDIVDNPDGSLTLYPSRTEANYLSMRLGISIPFGGGGHGDGGHEEVRYR
jgi:hypothetical protein